MTSIEPKRNRISFFSFFPDAIDKVIYPKYYKKQADALEHKMSFVGFSLI